MESVYAKNYMDNAFDMVIDVKNAKLSSKSLKHPHQINAVNALTDYFELSKNKVNRKGLLVMPTGSGKTFTAVYWLLKEAVAKGYIVIWVVHRQELITQTFKEFAEEAALLKDSKKEWLKLIPVSGSHYSMGAAYDKDIYILSRGSAGNKYGLRNMDSLLGDHKKVLMVIDEAHHAVSSQYQEIWQAVQTKAKYAALLGLTATPTRVSEASKGELLRFFNVDKNLKKNIGTNGFIYQVTLSQLLKSGFLAKAIPVTVATGINAVKQYHITDKDKAIINGEHSLSEEAFARIAANAKRNKTIVNEYIKRIGSSKKDYGKTIVFAINVAHAERLCADFNKALKKYNRYAEYVVSGKEGNQELIQKFKDNTDPHFKVLINVQIMTEGSDVPDVKTVFLTRETSSDVMLMQMIGRALRGENAGGTDIAYIVSFFDIWDRYNYWLNPESLDIFTDATETEDPESVEVEELPEIVAREFETKVKETPEGDIEILDEGIVDLTPEEELYQKIYNELCLDGTSYTPMEDVMPVGWYDVQVDDTKKTLIVYKAQLQDYESIAANFKKVLRKYGNDQLDGYRERFNKEYFQHMPPSVITTSALLRYIKIWDHMPEFFTFDECKCFDPQKLAKELKQRFKTKKDKEEWLKNIYNSNPVLQHIYDTYANFKITVFDAMMGKRAAVIPTELLVKKPYKIIENYYDLEVCLQEVLDMYPKLNKDGLVRIQWSKQIPRHWCALCQRTKDNKLFQITINKLYSSPYVNREVIKYLIFHELLHKNGYWKHDKDFRSREWQFKDSAKWDAFLDGVIYSVYDLSEYENQMPKRTVIKFPEAQAEPK